MNCIVCGSPSNLFGTKGCITVSYCIYHAEDCVRADASCKCG